MKLLLYAALLLWLPATVFSFAPFQHAGDPTPIRETIFYAKHGNPDWLNIREGVRISPEELLRLHTADMGLGAADELRVQRIDTDAMGFVHYRYQQYHQSVKVDGAEWLIHTQNGYVRTMNGKLVRGLRATVQTKLSAEEAIAKALAHIPAQRYMWEVASAEALLQRVDKDPNATFYPKPELVLVDPGFQRDPERFTLAWSMVVYAERPQTQKQVYVNAQDGKILSELELLHDQNTPGQAQTKYSGVREIITDSIDVGLYRLVETTRGGGIETYNLYQTTDHGSAIDFLDEDNLWNNVTPEKDEAATDAHWGAEMTFDYYFHKHNRSGIDGNNMPLISYVHYDYFWSNAQWTGKWAQFGDGDGNSWNPLTSLDVVGHEFTHGVTGNSAKLRYLNESGALNESFSDIFGTAIEFYADPEHADWLVGEDFVISGPPLRNMANPKQEDNPDTYKGEFWVSTSADNGGVHTNSGVQNYWFHLLAVGGSGTNDQSDSYAVAGIGLDSAAAIAYRNLNYYLVQLSDYADAREGSLQAAEDLYGICSTPVTETAKAWYAVGVGNALLDYDMRMLDIVSPLPKTCGLTNQQDVTVRFRYNGCAVSLQAGDKIPMAYQIDGNAIVWDTLTLGATLSGGDTLLFTFSEPSEVFAVAGNYWLRCWTGLGADMDQSNNALYTTVENIPDQNVDMRMEQVANLKSGCFLGVQSPSVEYSFYGCDSIPAGETITLFYRVNGGDPFSESIQLPYTLYRGGSLYHNFANFEDFSAKGPYVIDAWLQYGPDYLVSNDSVHDFRIVNPLLMHKENILTFEAATGSLDSMYSVPGAKAQGFLSAKAARTGALGFEITGGNIQQDYLDKKAQLPNKDNVWKINENYRSKTCICADLSNLVSADLKFDRKQMYSSYYRIAFGYNMPYASSMQVLVNDESISETYKPITQSVDAWKNHKLSLNDFVGNTVEICFQTYTGLNPTYDSTGVGDRVLLDNITITGQAVTGTSQILTQAPTWRVMPNPGSGAFLLSYQAPEAQTLRIDVLDALGRIVTTQNRNVSAGGNAFPLHLEGKAAGIYLIRLGAEGQQTSSQKLILR